MLLCRVTAQARSVSGSALWNSLPDHLRDPTQSSDSFRGNHT